MENIASKFVTASDKLKYSSFGPAGEFIRYALTLRDKLTELPGNQNHELIGMEIEDDPEFTWVRVTFSKLPPRFTELANWGEDRNQSFIEVQFRPKNAVEISSDRTIQTMRIARNDQPSSEAIDMGDRERYGKVTNPKTVKSAGSAIEEFEDFIQAELRRAADLSSQLSRYNNGTHRASSAPKPNSV